MEFMSRQEAESILADMFPPHNHTLVMNHRSFSGGCNISEVYAAIYQGKPEIGGPLPIHSAAAYDENDDLDQGGWSTVVNKIREQVEEQRDPTI